MKRRRNRYGKGRNISCNKNSISNLKNNEKGFIRYINNNCTSKRRLYELGLYKGAEVEVIKNDVGPIIIKINGNKIALGRGLAQDVIIDQNA